ncbi:MAG: nuclear transport factor 2 family protein [Hyphomonadaceae bacterium]
MALPNINSNVAVALEKWHAMVAIKDFAGLDAIIHPGATFRSPMAFKPYQSAQAVTLLLRTVLTVFEDFAYHRQLASEDGLSVVLEFSARVGDKNLKGVDLIRFDETGLIRDFEVMIRPLNSLQALGAEMGARLGHLLPAYKAGA